MLIKPKFEQTSGGEYCFGSKINARANVCLTGAIFQEFWNGFCCGKSEISFEKDENYVFIIGSESVLNAPDNGYKMVISEKGISIAASDSQNLIYGYLSLLERISPICTKKDNEKFSIPCCTINDSADIKVRMVHFCVFPETSLFFIKKLVRAAAFLRYTHIILEFWGSLKFDCLKELAWPQAFSKSEVRSIINEANQLGMEIVPMFNHWGHASFSRVITGKHVVLDQNLEFAPLFSRTGWEWDLSNPEVIDLHRKIRTELIELCGNGEYFHIGCDEAYAAQTKKDFDIVVNYINQVTAELKQLGRKPIMWGDMLLHESTLNPQLDNAYNCLSPSKEIQEDILRKLSRDIVIGDWEYEAEKSPIETATYFKKNGFEVLCCPWDRSKENVIASAHTVKENGLHGILHTTWDTIGSMSGIWHMMYSAALAWNETQFNSSHPAYHANELTAIMRKFAFPNGIYKDCGLTQSQLSEKI